MKPNPEDIRVIRSDRKTISLEIRPDLTVVLRVPRRMRKTEIERFLHDRRSWLEEHYVAMARRQAARVADPAQPPFTEGELEALGRQARALIPPRVAYYADRLGVTYGRIAIRAQHTRWGSCSARGGGNLNFNRLLVLCPPEVMDYVIIHELCHRKHMNHSAAFWQTVAAACPDYQAQKAWLKTHGPALIARLRGST